MMSLWVCVALLGVLGSATGHAGHECPEIHNANGRLTKEDIDMCCTKLNYWKRECAKPPKVNFPPEVVKYWESLETAVTHEGKEENASKHNRTKRQTATGRRDDTTINPPLYWQSRPIPPRPLPRKEYRLLSPAEKWRFHRALHAMKVTMVPNTEFSEYDIFTAYHQATEAPGAHFGPAFLPWHREFIKRFETAMQRHEPGVTLPYWDPTMDDGMPRPQDTIMWTPEYMGNGFGYVTSGPAANWNTPFPVANRTRLYRNLTAGVLEGRVPLLPNDLEMGFLYAGGRGLRDLSFYVDPSLEFVHGRVHDWIGGHMGDLENAPADPVFYMYHAYLDCWWDDYRQKQRSLGINPETDYPEDAEAQGVGGTTPLPEWPIPTRVEDSVHLPNKMMRPFRIRNIDGLSDDYTRLYYSCSPRPVCPSCNNSPILFCDNAQNIPKCRTKLQLNTNCTAYKDLNPCHQGECCAIGVGDQYMCRSSCSSFGPVRPIHQLPQRPQVQGPQQTGFDGRLHRGPNDQLPPQYVPNQIPNSVNIRPVQTPPLNDQPQYNVPSQNQGQRPGQYNVPSQNQVQRPQTIYQPQYNAPATRQAQPIQYRQTQYIGRPQSQQSYAPSYNQQNYNQAPNYRPNQYQSSSNGQYYRPPSTTYQRNNNNYGQRYTNPRTSLYVNPFTGQQQQYRQATYRQPPQTSLYAPVGLNRNPYGQRPQYRAQQASPAYNQRPASQSFTIPGQNYYNNRAANYF